MFRRIKIISCTVTLLAGIAFAQQDVDGQEILKKVDSVLYAHEDAKMQMTFVLRDTQGNEKVRKLNAMEKGTQHRLMRFTAPADQKGIAFLSLPDEVMYLYLPAFGKARRIAGHVKNKNFAGTDFTYENLEPKEYAEKWNAKIIEETDSTYLLELLPREGNESDYSKLRVRVRKENNYPVFVKYFDKAGNPQKQLDRKEIENVEGYWIARRSTMTQLDSGHSTTMIIEKVEFDTGIADNRFSKRELERG